MNGSVWYRAMNFKPSSGEVHQLLENFSGSFGSAKKQQKNIYSQIATALNFCCEYCES